MKNKEIFTKKTKNKKNWDMLLKFAKHNVFRSSFSEIQLPTFSFFLVQLVKQDIRKSGRRWYFCAGIWARCFT